MCSSVILLVTWGEKKRTAKPGVIKLRGESKLWETVNEEDQWRAVLGFNQVQGERKVLIQLDSLNQLQDVRAEKVLDNHSLI